MTVVRTPVARIRSSRVDEHWTAETREELMEEFQRVERNYPTQGYGTSLLDVRPDPTGLLWHAEFYRYTSCD